MRGTMGAMAGAPSPADQVEATIERLRAHGERVTRGRRAVLEVMADADAAGDHLSSEGIFRRAVRTAPGLHQATVYRALATWSRLGVVEHVHLGGTAAVYHLSARTPPGAVRAAHGHLHCTTCGTVTDVPAELLAPLQRSVQQRLGFSLDPQQTALLGTCSTCASGSDLSDRPGRTAGRTGE